MKQLSALLLLTLLGSSIAEASSTIRHSVGAYYRPYGGFWGGQEFSGSAPSYEAVGLESYAQVAGGGTYGHMWGEGVAHASAQSFASHTASAFSFIDDNRWDDVLTIHSDSLAPGTPVLLEVTMKLRSQQTASGTVSQGVSAWFSCYGTTVFININSTGLVEQQQTGTCPTAVGEQRTIAGVFYARSGVEANHLTPVELSHGSYSAEAWYTIRMLTPGADFSSASGASYATMVPEPATGLLMLGGLAALLGLRRRRVR